MVCNENVFVDVRDWVHTCVSVSVYICVSEGVHVGAHMCARM